MTSLRLTALFCLLTLLLAGCGGEPESPAPAAQTEPAESPAPASQPAEPAAEPQPEPVAEQPEAEPAADQAEESAATPAPVAQTQDWQYKAGRHFTELTTAKSMLGGPDGIEVVEVFWYGCPHCYSFDPIVDKWKKQLGPDTRFVRMPVMWNPTNEIHARMYYVAESLGKLDEIHMGAFNALHREGKTLTRKENIREFFAQYGVSEADFDNAWDNFPVKTALGRADKFTNEGYVIESVPVLVVNGKYVVNGPEIRSFDDMLAVTNELVARERAER